MMTDLFRSALCCRRPVSKAVLRACLGLLATAQVHAEFDLEDIRFWVGHGTNRAALVLDWNDGIDPVSLAWGYRWNGTMTGRDMFEAVVAADPRLARFIYTSGFLGQVVYGVGYDVDGDGGAFHPGTAGIGTETGYADDPDDHYEEGWYSQYWHYSLGVGDPFSGGSWIESGSGFGVRQLEDGDWDGWRPAVVTFPVGSNPPPVECVAAMPGSPLPAIPMAGFALDEIEFWTGAGSNRAALVMDWHDRSRRHALAWGYRWDGEATALDMWQAVTNADSALTGSLTNTPDGLVLAECAYQRPVRHGDILPGTHAHDVVLSSFSTDHTNATAQSANWSHWTIDYSDIYFEATPVDTIAGLDNRMLYDGSWDVWSRSTGTVARTPGWPSAALHYPYGDSVVTYTEGTGIGFDWITGDPFTDSTAALGRPTVDTTGDDGAIDFTNAVPVVPVYAPFRAHELVTVGLGGELVLAFDHKVLDNPANPYGVDFLLFGNAMQLIGTGEEWENGTPTNTTVSAVCETDEGGVSVSQDGVTWHAFVSNRCDRFMPTLGRVYDPGHTYSGHSNAWWGGATDPTVPPDPSVGPDDWEGESVGALAQRYRGSAGGTGFDIGDLPLAPCPATGHKWIRYVRIAPTVSLAPEVDAMADVAPGLPQQLWRTCHFAWMGAPAEEADGADADHDGIVNLMAYGLGRSPTNGTGEAAFAAALDRASTPPRLDVSYTVSTHAPDVDVGAVRTVSLLSPDWSTDGIQSTAAASTPSNGVLPMADSAVVDSGGTFLRLRVRHDE